MGDEGTENIQNPANKQGPSQKIGAERGAVADIPDDLLNVIKCWPQLLPTTRRAIVMIATVPT